MTPAEVTRRTALPRHEAERLLAAAMGLPRHKAMTRTVVPGPMVAAHRRLVARRRSGEPLQYIEGSVPFGPVEVQVDPRVLIPRPETEQLFALVASWGPPEIVVDMCTGSGCLGVALGAVYPEATVYLTDVSRAALEVADENATRNGVTASITEGDCFEALPASLRGSIDRFVANPPYVAESHHAGLERQVRNHEPTLALVAGADGLDVLRRIASDLASWLAPGGSFAIEIGHDQGDEVSDLIQELDVEIVADGYGRPRFAVGRKAP